jgi:hypothetical protein
MKHIKLTPLIFGLLFFGCNQAEIKTASVVEEKPVSTEDTNGQIQDLIRQTLNWAESTNSINLLPVLADSEDSIYIGFNFEKHKQNLEMLRQTNFFAAEFIDNYNQIILTLDKGLKNGSYEPWLVGDLPTFVFANDVDPWSMCQDVPYDKPSPWDFVETNITSLDNGKGEANWRWGKLELNTDPGWKNFSYKFRVVKENDKWKIAFLQGFDLKEGVQKM